MTGPFPSRHRPGPRAALLALLLVLLPCAVRADIRIGYIDSSKIFTDYKVAQEAQARFDRQIQDWRDEAAEKEKAVTQLRNEVRDQGPILSAQKRQEKEEGLQRAQADYERFIQEIWGPQGKASQENERSTSEVVTQIRNVVEKIATDKNLNLVLDAAGGYIIYADKTMDLTPLVLQELNLRAATGVTK